MRSSPASGNSPSASPKTRNKIMECDRNRTPVDDLDGQARQVQFALKHLRDVINKNKLEMLPGNGTIVLEVVTTIHGVLKNSLLGEQSSTLVSASNQVYQCLANLIRLCDEYILDGEKALSNENVLDVIQQVDDAVKNLVSLAQEKMSSRDSGYKSSCSSVILKPRPLSDRSSLDSQRSSLPDIPLTPREKEILEQTSSMLLDRHAQSSESVLLDVPPPKPPLPDRNDFPPPLPPKRRHRGHNNDLSVVSNHVDRLSLRSKSPEDSSSLLSGSLDSVLNHSRDEEEMQELIGDSDENLVIRDSMLNGNSSCCCWDSSSSTSNEQPLRVVTESPVFLNENVDLCRFSQAESGISSMHSHRSSSQSYSTTQTFEYHSDKKLHQTSIEDQSYQKKTSTSSSKTIIQKTELRTESPSLFQNVRCCHDNIIVSNNTSPLETSPHRTTSPGKASPCSLDEAPPALPEKNKTKKDRHHSQYDNLPDTVTVETKICLDHKQMAAATTISDSLGTTRSTVSLSNHSSLSTATLTVSDLVDGVPPPLPPKKKHIMAYMEVFGNASHNSTSDFLRHSVHSYSIGHHQQQISQSYSFTASSVENSPARSIEIRTKPGLPPALPPKRSRAPSTRSVSSPPPTPPITSTPKSIKDEHFVLELPPTPIKIRTPSPTKPVEPTEISPLDLVDVSSFLVVKKTEEDGPDIRGGHPLALLVHATQANEFLYQEAFLTTYRTFLTPLQLIEKLLYRYDRFTNSMDGVSQRAARDSFSLLVRVVNDLTLSDLRREVLQRLMDFVQQLLCKGDLPMAKALRVKLIEKVEKRDHVNNNIVTLSSQHVSTKHSALLDFKSEQVAEQMTLLDAELFLKIEIPEVLIWAQEQNEERSPNLTRFTEHFNNMSYWARSRILDQNDAKDREKYVTKFIKIMKHLRKINNFNSYLALLSALDSAPIRRLEWQKHITEGLKEYCALIDSSSSFRAYRQALAETQPPCIPYIGLVLQDLTFVHIGNNDLLPGGGINFSKRWQQFNIVENMKRFKKGVYGFKKNERIIAFFNNFEDSISEEAMWQISESIKPRGGKKT